MNTEEFKKTVIKRFDAVLTQAKHIDEFRITVTGDRETVTQIDYHFRENIIPEDKENKGGK